MSEIIQKQDTRRTFIETLIELAEKDDKIVLVLMDTGFNYIEKFKEKFPNRCYNLGVTEQSSMIIASALALSGLKPYIYSMIPFVLFRSYEMVRNMVVLHKANVKILGVQGGPSYKMLGFSHNLTHPDEDTKLCENIGLKTYLPKTNEEVRQIILDSYAEEIPSYTRL